jgi:hypothetical protein
MAKGRRAREAEAGLMTTTVTLPRALMERAKIAAIKRRITFKMLVQEAIREHLARKEDGR